jgi:hypothetical protein
MVDEKCIAVWCGNLRESYHLENVWKVGWRSVGWIHLTQYTDKWRVLVNALENHRTPYISGNFSAKEPLSSEELCSRKLLIVILTKDITTPPCNIEFLHIGGTFGLLGSFSLTRLVTPPAKLSASKEHPAPPPLRPGHINVVSLKQIRFFYVLLQNAY